MKRAAAVLLALSAAPTAAGNAAGETLRDAGHQYQIDVPAGWTAGPTPPATLAVYQAEGGAARLTITTVNAPRPSTLRNQQRVVNEIERGVERATRAQGRAYRRVKRRLTSLREVPVLDLWYQRDPPSQPPELVMSRFLLFRTHAVVLSVGLSAAKGAPRSLRRAGEAAVRSFRPASD